MTAPLSTDQRLLVKRLRECREINPWWPELMRDAADEIDRLQGLFDNAVMVCSQNVLLRAALRRISDGNAMVNRKGGYTHADVAIEYQRIASEALGNAEDTEN